MAVHDFNQAALNAYRKRQKRGAFEVVTAGSPLAIAAEAAPNVDMIDIDWLAETVMQLLPEKQNLVRAAAHMAAQLRYGTPTTAEILGEAYHFMRYAESAGALDDWRAKP